MGVRKGGKMFHNFKKHHSALALELLCKCIACSVEFFQSAQPVWDETGGVDRASDPKGGGRS